MTIKLKYYNYNNNCNDELNIYYPDISYEDWKRTKEFNNDLDLCNILDNFLKDMDCTRIFNGCRLCMTSYPIYKIIMSKYYYYLLKIQNQFIYNKYLDKLLLCHNYNIVYEHTIKNDNKPIILKKKSKLPPNKYVRYRTIDMFTNKEVYLYINARTNHEIKSDNPNLLDELNNKKKVKQPKQNGVPLEAMTFSFKK